MDYEWFCAGVGDEIGRMASAAKGADPAIPVPTCPGWTLAKLVKHTGITHRWAAHIVTTRASGWIPQRDVDVKLPGDEAAYPEWLASGAAPLLAALREAGPDTAVWAWGAGQNAGWWARRMLHETTVHRVDAEIAIGAKPRLDPEVATDGIDELLGNLAIRNATELSELPAGESVHLHATDSGGEWLITFEPGGCAWQRGHAKATAAVRAPVALLLLFGYGRIRPDDERLAVFGDTALLAAWQGKMAF